MRLRKDFEQMTGVPPDIIYSTRRRQRRHHWRFLFWLVVLLAAVWISLLLIVLVPADARAATQARRCVPDTSKASRYYPILRWPRGCRVPQ